MATQKKTTTKKSEPKKKVITYDLFEFEFSDLGKCRVRKGRRKTFDSYTKKNDEVLAVEAVECGETYILSKEDVSALKEIFEAVGW